MALDFPSSPTNGQSFGAFTYDSSLPGWRSTPEVASGLAAGTMVQWPGATPPANWLICDGSAISRANYASLFAAIGVTYGAGDGSTTFNLPNLKGRAVVGRDSSQTEFDTLGETGGAKTHTLTTSEMPSHKHTESRRIYGASTGNSHFGYTIDTTDTTVRLNQVAGTSDAHSLTDFTGGGGAHNNLQPYIVLNYIIKTSAGVTAGDSELASRVGVVETSSSSMTGAVLPFAKGTAPSGWLIADGSALSRSTYSLLFSVIGTTHGAGDGSSTFNIPDMRGRVPVGKNTGTFSTLGGAGGAETHTLSTAEIPSHTHTEDYIYYQPNFTTIPAGSNYPAAGAYTPSQSGSLQRASDPTGGGGAHNNLQPYLTLLYCIKY